MENRNPLDLIFRLLLLLLCAVVFATVCVGCKPKEILRESTDTVYIAHDITRIDTIANAIHDSIYVREIVTTQGEVQYKEKVVYRDNTKVKYRDRVVRDTIYKARIRESESVKEATTQSGHTRGKLVAAIVAAVIFVGAIGYGIARKIARKAKNACDFACDYVHNRPQ